MIDFWSSKPLVKEDDVDREKRHASTKKQKSTKDAEKKKTKKKNLERQALEARRAKSRCGGESEVDSPDEDDESDDGDDDDDSEGMAARLDRILEDPPRTDVDIPHAGASKGPPAGPRDGRQKEVSPRCSRAETPLLPHRVGSLPSCNPLQRSARAIGSRA